MSPVRSSAWFFLCLAAAACGDGGGGDSAPSPRGSVRGDGRSITELTDRANHPAPPETEIQRVTGARITAIDAYDETGKGQTGAVFAQDATGTPGPYQGIQLFKPAFSPPSFRPTPGDVVDIAGLYEEFQIPGLAFLDTSWKTPQLTGATVTLRLDAGGGAQAPAPLVLTDLWLYPTGKKWLSLLVTVEGAVISGPLIESGGRATYPIKFPGPGMPPVPDDGTKPVNGPTVTNELFDLKQVMIPANVPVKRITGIVTIFDGFHIAPRSAADIEL